MTAKDKNLADDTVAPGDQQTGRPDQPDPSAGDSPQPPRENPPGPDPDPDDGLPRDDDGGLINPPIIPAYEREMVEAQNSADVDLIADVQERYTEARENLARRRAEREAAK